jgi:hypothetical protein
MLHPTELFSISFEMRGVCCVAVAEKLVAMVEEVPGKSPLNYMDLFRGFSPCSLRDRKREKRRNNRLKMD